MQPEIIAMLAWGDILLYISAVLLMALGIAGCVLPYPGHLALLGGCALWSCAAHGEKGVWLWVTLGVLALVGCFADNIFTLLGVKWFKCSRYALYGCLIGIILGAFFFPVGLFLGPFLGALIGQLISGCGIGPSTGVATAVLIATLLGMLVKMVIAGLMLLLFFVW